MKSPFSVRVSRNVGNSHHYWDSHATEQPHTRLVRFYFLLIHYLTDIWECLILIGGPQLYQEYLDAYEIWGVLPTLRLSSVADLGPERVRTQELLSVTRTWQQRRIQT